MAITVRQLSAGASSGSSTALASAFASPTLTGNGIVACLGSVSRDATSVTDDGSNTYVEVVTANFFTSPYASIWYCANPTGFTGNVYANFGTGTQVALAAAEVYGVLTADVSSGNFANATNATAGAITTTGGNRIIFGSLQDNTVTASPAGFTSMYRALNADLAYQVVTSIQTAYNPAWTNTVGGYGAVIAAFSSTNTTGPVPFIGQQLFEPRYNPGRANPVALLPFANRALTATTPVPPGPGRGRNAELLRREPYIEDESRSRSRRSSDTLSILYNALLSKGHVRKNSSADYSVIGGAYVTNRDPTVNDDTVQNFPVGASWINTVAQTEWVCISNAKAAALWKKRAS